jgi:hypothetical protein
MVDCDPKKALLTAEDEHMDRDTATNRTDCPANQVSPKQEIWYPPLRQMALFLVKGDLQGEGFYLKQKYSPTVSKETLRLFLSISTLLDFQLQQIDVNRTFLHCETGRKVLIERS